MQPELKEFLSALLPEGLLEAAGKRLFLRNRAPAEAKVFASYVYMSQGSSLRRTKGLLCDLDVHVSHVSIWKWL